MSRGASKVISTTLRLPSTTCSRGKWPGKEDSISSPIAPLPYRLRRSLPGNPMPSNSRTSYPPSGVRSTMAGSQKTKMGLEVSHRPSALARSVLATKSIIDRLRHWEWSRSSTQTPTNSCNWSLPWSLRHLAVATTQALCTRPRRSVIGMTSTSWGGNPRTGNQRRRCQCMRGWKARLRTTLGMNSTKGCPCRKNASLLSTGQRTDILLQ